MKKIKFKKNDRKLLWPNKHRIVPAKVTQNIILTLTFCVTFSFQKGSIVVIVDIKALYKLKTLIAS